MIFSSYLGKVEARFGEFWRDWASFGGSQNCPKFGPIIELGMGNIFIVLFLKIPPISGVMGIFLSYICVLVSSVFLQSQVNVCNAFQGLCGTANQVNSCLLTGEGSRGFHFLQPIRV